MALTSGNRVGPYEILAAIGAGGMGEVYRARDAKLGRDVALKVLPEAFARDAERMARFQREAKVLASLNHPNIATIYGLEDSGTTHALVMELVEGPTLADRIGSGPIPISEALPIAKQMCEALEYAHERGIVHRDLKPANVKVTNDDAVKVLDFGLAKALEGDASSIDIANSPTVSRMATQAGVLLGTAAYMSPEQAKGKQVDRRADIWAFGCVLYEILTGTMAFTGETATDTLAAVLKNDPDWSRLPVATPNHVRVLLGRCLQKDVRRRLQAIGDARIALEEVLSGTSEAVSSVGVSPANGTHAKRRTLLFGLGALLIAAITGFVGWNLGRSPAPRPVTRTAINLPPGEQLPDLLFGPAVALSPDGTHLAYVAMQGSSQQIYLRAMDSLEARPLPGTAGAVNPFFSPDSQWLGFFTDGKLKKISVNGGEALSLAGAPFAHGASWGRQGMIVFAPALVGVLQQVPESGGTPQPLTRFQKPEITHRWPEVLPGGKAVLFDTSIDSGIAVQSIATGERKNLIPGGAQPRYASSGHLVYAQGGTLMAVPFDSQRLTVTGAAVPVVEDVVQSANGAAQYSLSAAGTLVYVPGGAQRNESQLVWVNRDGTEQPLAAPPRAYLNPRLSPDGKRVAVTTERQIWVYDLSRDTLTRLTFEGESSYPIWTPDGKRIAFESAKNGSPNLFWRPSDGSGGVETLTAGEYYQILSSWSPDGKLLAFVDVNPSTGYDIWVLRMSDRKAQPFLQTAFSEAAPQFSPDGRWLAYVSDESGRNEVYVQPYPGPGGKWLISTDGGTEPMWNRNGRELFYRNGEKMMNVDIATQHGFTAGKPRMLFEGRYEPTPGTLPNYDVSPDGLRFLMVKPTEQAGAAPTQINVVLNWFEELKRRVPAGTK
jgi:serine/threonine-protein kinase